MIFVIDPPGTGYTRVTIDAPNGQLADIIRAVTSVQASHEDQVVARQERMVAARQAARLRHAALHPHPAATTVAVPEADDELDCEGPDAADGGDGE